jgi:hypothetical protein
MDETETAVSTVANETANATETASNQTETASNQTGNPVLDALKNIFGGIMGNK